MIEYVTVGQVLELHRKVIEDTGGSGGLRDAGGLASAVSQPATTFGGMDLYPELWEKAAALGFSLILNHAFVDGNKRVGHAAMVALLRLNGANLVADIDDQERVILAVAAGEMEREEFAAWIRDHVVPRS